MIDILVMLALAIGLMIGAVAGGREGHRPPCRTPGPARIEGFVMPWKGRRKISEPEQTQASKLFQLIGNDHYKRFLIFQKGTARVTWTVVDSLDGKIFEFYQELGGDGILGVYWMSFALPSTEWMSMLELEEFGRVVRRACKDDAMAEITRAHLAGFLYLRDAQRRARQDTAMLDDLIAKSMAAPVRDTTRLEQLEIAERFNDECG